MYDFFKLVRNKPSMFIWVDFLNLVLWSKLLNHFLCSDTDECTDHAHDCHMNALCTNSEGNYTCTCKDGYDGDGKNCTGKFERYISLIIINTVICQMMILSFNLFYFLDVDECATNMHGCHYNASCINTNGSYNCRCKPGLNCSKYDFTFIN